MKFLIATLFILNALFPVFAQKNTETEEDTNFSNSSEEKTIDIVSTSYVGYSGNTELPIGYHLGGSFKLGFYAELNHKFDFSGNQDFFVSIGKPNIIKVENFSSYLNISYRYRKLDFLKEDIDFNNTQISLSNYLLNAFSIVIGGEHLRENSLEKYGFVLGTSFWANKLNILMFGKACIYNEQTNFEIGISKSFYFFNQFQIQISYEKFYTYEDVNFSLLFWF